MWRCWVQVSGSGSELDAETAVDHAVGAGLCLPRGHRLSPCWGSISSTMRRRGRCQGCRQIPAVAQLSLSSSKLPRWICRAVKAHFPPRKVLP